MIVYVRVFGMSDVRSRCREFALGDPERQARAANVVGES
jgi:hypothetical protein